MMQSVGDAEFQLAVEVLYHGRRRDFLMAAHRWMIFAVIIFGSAAAAASPWLALAAVAAGAADIAFGFTDQAQVHSDIRRRYYGLIARLAVGDLSDADFAREWMIISADEPPLYRWAERLAYEAACVSLRREPEGDLLPRRRRLLAHFCRG